MVEVYGSFSAGTFGLHIQGLRVSSCTEDGSSKLLLPDYTASSLKNQ
jgi:hypothetical protein